MLVGLSRVAWERNDLAAAADHLRRADELGESAALAQNPYRWRVAMARLREAEGDSVDRPAAPRGGRSVCTSATTRPTCSRCHAVHARVLAARGDLAEALAWARRQGLSAADDLSYLHEYEHVTLARILIAQHAGTRSEQAMRDALGLLDRLLAAAEAGGRVGTVIEILTLQARRAGSDVAPLERALTLAEPDGWLRVFVGAGQPMPNLLETLGRHRPDWDFLREVTAAARPPADDPSSTTTPTDGGLVDPLSDRELDVLRLLASDLDGPDIARHLVVSLNTVRTHTKHIYTKLGVNNRRAAVSTAHQLGSAGRSR